MSKSSSGTPKRVAAGLLAGALAIFGLALAPSAGATNHETTTERLAGTTRFSTAGDVCGQLEEAHDVTTVVIASGRNFPDALAAAPLATAVDGCILLVEPDELPDATLATLRQVLPDRVIIVGGTDAVSADVEAAVRDEVPDTDRVAGVDRFCTAGEIAGEIGAANVAEAEGEGATAVLATGRLAPDALSAGPLAAYGEANTGDGVFPILLAEPNGDLPACTQAALEALNITNVIVIGGTAAISEATASDAETITGDAEATRLAGTTRETTATAVATFLLDEQGFAMERVVLATGRPPAEVGTFSPDALVAGPYAAFYEAPILLVAGVDSLGSAIEDFLEARGGATLLVICVGGTAVISNATCAAAATAAEQAPPPGEEPTGNQAVTTRPELVSASIVGTTTATNETATNPRGTTVRYCFDEAVTGSAPVAGNFHLYTSGGQVINPSLGGPAGNSGLGGTAGGPLAAIATDDSKCVNVFYGQQNTATSVQSVTLATVDAGAVADVGGTAGNPNSTTNNPEGDAPLSPSGSGTTAAAGITDAPDLLTVGNFRTGSTFGVTAVDFTFDEAAFTTAAADFELILANNTAAQCTAPAPGSEATPSGGTVPGGRGTTTITVTCANPGAVDPNPATAGEPGELAGTALTGTNVARGIVRSGSVGDLTGGGNLNPLQAAEVITDGITTGPDLASAIFLPDQTPNVDIVAYVFDEAVNATFANGGTPFRIYRVNGTEATGLTIGGSSPLRSSENNRIVTVVFPDNTLVNAVGASVDNGAVTDVDSSQANQPDEVGVNPTSGSTVTAGRTDGPDLIAVRSEAGTSPFGNPTRRITYVFDEDVSDAPTIANLYAYTPDGIRLRCSQMNPTSAANRTADNRATITCDAFIVVDSGAAATVTQISNAVLGTADNGAVTERTGAGLTNPEGAEVITGSAGTPAA